MPKRTFMKKLTALSLCFCSAAATTACTLPTLPQSHSESVAMQNEVSVTVFTSKSPVSLIHDSIQTYLQSDGSENVTAYLPNDSVRYDQGNPVTFTYQLQQNKDSAVKKIAIEFSFTEDFFHVEQRETFSNSESRLLVYNLQTGKKYYYRFTVTLQNGSKATATGCIDTEESPRFLRLEGASNVRDIGGWKTASGKTVKQGVLYRGGEIDGGKNVNHPDFCLTTKGIIQLRALGIKTDFDLRSKSNKVGDDSILGADVTRTFYNAAQYQSILQKSNAEKTRKIFSDLAKPEAYPVYLHCTHGVDRAGSTVFLLEALLGLSKTDLIRDYELSAFYYNYKHVNRDMQNGGNILALMDGLDAYEGDTFAEKTANFLLSIGVTQAEIDSIREIFLA